MSLRHPSGTWRAICYGADAGVDKHQTNTRTFARTPLHCTTGGVVGGSDLPAGISTFLPVSAIRQQHHQQHHQHQHQHQRHPHHGGFPISPPLPVGGTMRAK